jgi:hypothetical protein
MPKTNLKALSVIMLALLWSVPLLGQPSVLWQKSYGGDTKEDEEIGYAIAKTSDGGFVIAGEATDVKRDTTPGVWTRPEVKDRTYLVKTDSKGSVQWTKKLRGNEGYAVHQTSDGGYVVIARSASDEFYLIKTDSKGDTLWTKAFEAAAGRSVAMAPDGGIIAIGSKELWGPSRRAVLYMLKIDTAGNTLWEKEHVLGADVKACCIRPTSDGGYVVTGKAHRPEAGYGQLFFVKTDANGDTLWIRYFGGDDNEEGRCVIETSDGGYLAVGTTTSFGNTREFYAVKIDSKGDSLWAKHYGVQHYAEILNGSVVATGDGKYLIIGSIDSSPNPQLYECGQVYIVKIDGTGKKLWSKYYGKKHSSESAYGVVKVSDGYVIVGSDYPKKSSDGSRVRHDSDLYLLKISR